jgi:hypothetical protein
MMLCICKILKGLVPYYCQVIKKKEFNRLYLNSKLFKTIYDIYCFEVDKNQKLVKY